MRVAITACGWIARHRGSFTSPFTCVGLAVALLLSSGRNYCSYTAADRWLRASESRFATSLKNPLKNLLFEHLSSRCQFRHACNEKPQLLDPLPTLAHPAKTPPCFAEPDDLARLYRSGPPRPNTLSRGPHRCRRATAHVESAEATSRDRAHRAFNRLSQEFRLYEQANYFQRRIS